MKRFFTAVVFCIAIGFFLAACMAPTADSKRGYGRKKSMPRQAQEQVVDEGTAPRSK